LNRKNNFIITITDLNVQADINPNPGLPKYYNFKTGNLNISLHFSANTVFAKSKDENIIILLSGYIYQDDFSDNIPIEEYLLEKYSLYKKDFVKYLNGSFCIFFAQKNAGDVYLATDRVNSRKVFNYKKGKKLLFSTDIKDLPLHECELSYAGLTSYLLNGALHNDLTLFDEIKKLERASLHKIVDFKITSNKYWDYYFTNEYENRSESDLAEELHHIYLQSLKRIIYEKKNIFISLSGGYDSRGIAVMLRDILQDISGVTCFSYHAGDFLKNSDSDIANQVAEKLKFAYRVVNLYNGDPFSVIKNNAELGQGLAYFSVELDAWKEINRNFTASDNSVLLIGDMHEGGRISIQFHGNLKRALEKLTIYGSEFLKEYKDYIDPDIMRDLSESWDTEYYKILNKASEFDNIVNLVDYLYIDQRIPNVMCAVRECFQMPFIETASPYYDNDVLDFYRKLTPNLRDFMRLHKMTIVEKYPEIFKINISTEHWGLEPVWIDEIHTFSETFIDDIKKHESKLDTIIPPDKIITSINGLKNRDMKNKDKSYLKLLHDSLSKILPSYYKFIEILPGGKELTRKAGSYVNPRITYTLEKILIQRLFLTVS